MLAVTVSAMLLLGALVDAQCTYQGNQFNLPTWSTPVSFPQWCPLSCSQCTPGLSADKMWQVTLCGPSSNANCQSGNNPSSYIFELNGNGNGCDTGFSQNVPAYWTLTNYPVGSQVQALKSQFRNSVGDRVANVYLICGGDSTLQGVPAPDSTNNGWKVYPGQVAGEWDFDLVFQTTSLPICGGPNPPPPPPPPPATPNPPGPTPQPAPGSCVASDGTPFKLPARQRVTAPQYAPQDASLDGERQWELSLCAATSSVQCDTRLPASFVLDEGAPSKPSCEAGFNIQVTNWTEAHGGLNAQFTTLEGTRVANVTLVCGPNATALTPVLPSSEGWRVHRLGDTVTPVWVTDMWLASGALPQC